MNTATYLSINAQHNCLSNELKTIETIKHLFSGFDILLTDKNEPAHVDGFIAKKGVLRACFECKSTTLSLDKIRLFGYELAQKKANDLFTITYLLKVPTYLILYVVNDNCYLIWRISELDKKRWTVYAVPQKIEVKTERFSQVNSELRKINILRLYYENTCYFFKQ